MKPAGQSSVVATRVISGDAPDAITIAAAALKRGEIVGIPTDTVYGLAAAVDHPYALDRLYLLKGRPSEKAIPVLIADADQLSQIAAEAPDAARTLAARFWPGALTLVLAARPDLPNQVSSADPDGSRTVAVRIPDHSLARAIIAAAGGALAVTSANRSGEQPCRTADEVAVLGSSAPDLVIDGGMATGGVPSTIVSLFAGVPTILREGAIATRDIVAADSIEQSVVQPRLRTAPSLDSPPDVNTPSPTAVGEDRGEGKRGNPIRPPMSTPPP